ncbi:unnamed protein product, partial [Prorocentrum cordatum]
GLARCARARQCASFFPRGGGQPARASGRGHFSAGRRGGGAPNSPVAEPRRLGRRCLRIAGGPLAVQREPRLLLNGLAAPAVADR